MSIFKHEGQSEEMGRLKEGTEYSVPFMEPPDETQG
jgi:hypothetical protein